ncbi:MAG: hypothetical protein HZC29_09435 [Thaumarchaeota archaeon]|nr:hypothetical protein [Nitrososphaerota archaeon]
MGIKTKSSENESMTFRLESASLEKLKSKAKDERISLNTLVNQIIVGYAEWDLTATSAGWMVMPKFIMKKLFARLTEKEVEQLAKETFSEVKDIVIFMTNKIDLDGFLSVLRVRSKKSGFQVKEIVENNKITFIIQHDLGIKWSLFSRTFYEGVLHSLEKRATFEITENTLVINVEY